MSQRYCPSSCKHVDNVYVYDLDECLIAAGYPMRTQTAQLEDVQLEEKDLKRGIKLSKATLSGNQAHDQFLTGIRVSFDLRLSNKAWVEAERYRFLEFVSSQSTMHRITKFEIRNQYNKYVDSRIIEIMAEKVDHYNQLITEKERLERIGAQNKPVYKEHLEICKEAYLEILYSNPAGFELTARMTTNYRCLKNIYKQRHDHRLPEWREVCEWITTLPYAHELILCDSDS